MQQIEQVEIEQRIAVSCPQCYDSGWVMLGVAEGGEEHDVLVPCRRCERAATHRYHK